MSQQSVGGVAPDFLQVITIAADHPAFAGHFPGRPIVPGVVLLDQVLIALQARLNLAPAARCEIATVKFLSPVGPGEQVQLTASRQTGETVISVRFELADATRKIASGHLKFHLSPTS